MLSTQQRAYLQLHLAVFLFGFTAILGDLIQLSAVVLVWWRVLITSLSLVLVIRVHQLYRQLGPKKLLRFAGIGVLIALHWVAFYGAIKLANASVALICMATTSLFTSVLEPLIVGRPVSRFEILLSITVIPAMILIASSIPTGMGTGFLVGLLAALLAALFAILNKKFIRDTDPLRITFIELTSAWLFLSLLLPLVITYSDTQLLLWPSPTDWVYLVVLALLCTTVAQILALKALYHLNAFVTNLTNNLEPVYGIVLAWLILGDHRELSPTFYVGTAIILLTVIIYPLYRR